MKRYNINKITNDVCEFLLVYDYEDFIRMLDFIEGQCGNFYDMESTLKNKSLQEYIEIDLIHYQCLLKILSIDIQTISPFDFINNIGGKISIDDSNGNEIYVYVTYSIIDKEFKIKYPKYEDIDVNIEKVDMDKLDHFITEVLITNDFVTKKEASEGKIGCSDIYLNIKNNDCLLEDVLDDEQTLIFYVEKGHDSTVKLNEKIKVKNKTLGHGNIVYTISKIETYHPLELSDEIVKELRYQKCKTVSEFKERIAKDASVVKTFKEIMSNIKDNILESNEEIISYECLNLYKDYVKIFSDSDIGEEDTREFIKIARMSTYLDLELKKLNIDTFLVENIIRTQYALEKLLDKDIEDYDRYLEKNINALKLYLYVKNNK